MTRHAIKGSIFVLAASIVFASPVNAQSGNCTPRHLLSTLRQVEAQCGAAKVVSGYRRGATIRGTGRVSQHSFCNGTNGAIDAVFSNRACALSALRKTKYMVLTYGRSAHIHFGTDGWGSGRRGGVHVAQKQWPRVPGQDDWTDWSSANASANANANAMEW